MRRTMAALATIVVLGAAMAAPAHADRHYKESDSEVLAVTATFLRPVGQILEAVFFRPLHAVSHFLDPNDGITDRPVRECHSLRPRRDCSSDY